MTDPRAKIYKPKLFMLSDDEIAIVAKEAMARNPEKSGEREQSGVVRDALQFMAAHRSLFLQWIATRS